MGVSDVDGAVAAVDWLAREHGVAADGARGRLPPGIILAAGASPLGFECLRRRWE